ncbi:MAG: imidazole glycerol phosphate synthase subunit HisF [Candidatus Marinimicrobia bacterium]|nr:imidazole glycerol phosphate synthase subunit HisF [Candidatus Neomarinimicrobiota bacterium]
MEKLRLIARIDVKNQFAIKGIHLEGLRKIGYPNDLALDYYNSGIDEIIFMDSVAAYYDRNSLSEIIDEACNSIFVPITVGGGIRNIQDINNALKSGADKVSINTESLRNPNFILEASKVFGSQCIVASIDAKKRNEETWEAYFDNGREPSGKDAIEWAKELQDLGAGEILITSIDKEGTKRGFDVSLVQNICSVTSIPVIACGGAGSSQDIVQIANETEVSAVSISSLIHYNLDKIENIKNSLRKNKINIRI